MPAVPPYPSTTIARCPRRRIRDNASSSGRVSGTASAGRASSAGVAAAGSWRRWCRAAPRMSRTCAAPTTSSRERPRTGWRECGRVTTHAAASSVVMAPSMKSIWVRGIITSEQPPDPVEPGRGEQCDHFGPLHCQPLRDQLAEHERHVRHGQRDEHQPDRRGQARRHTPSAEDMSQIHREGRAAVARREEPGGGDADLRHGQEPARVLPQPGDRSTLRALLGEPADRPVAQRDERHLRRRGVAADQHEQQDQDGVQEPATRHLAAGSISP